MCFLCVPKLFPIITVLCENVCFQETSCTESHFAFTNNGHVGHIDVASGDWWDKLLHYISGCGGSLQWPMRFCRESRVFAWINAENLWISRLRSVLSQRLGSFWLIINHPAANILVMLLRTINSLICDPQCFFNQTMLSICWSLLNVFVKTQPCDVTVWVRADWGECSWQLKHSSASPKSLISCFKSAQMPPPQPTQPSGGNRLLLAWQPCTTVFNSSW